MYDKQAFDKQDAAHDVLPGVKALYLAFASRGIDGERLSPSAAATRTLFMRQAEESLQRLRGNRLLRQLFVLHAEAGPELVINACGALYYAKALAKTIDRAQVQAMRALVGTALYTQVLRRAASLRIAPHPLTGDLTTLLPARGRAVLSALSDDPLHLRAMVRCFGEHDPALCPDLAVAALIADAACACVQTFQLNAESA